MNYLPASAGLEIEPIIVLVVSSIQVSDHEQTRDTKEQVKV